MLRTALPEIVTGSVPGPKAKEIIDRRDAAVPGAIRCAYPVAIARGEGAMIEDVDGNRFLDWIGGVGVLNIGFSHPVIMDAPENVTFETPNANTIVVKGISKQVVGNLAADIRAIRKPEPYLGKGIKYADEHIRRKEGKTGKK